MTESASSGGASPAPVFSAAELQCEPFYTDWGAWGTLSVSGADVVPGAVYAVQMIEDGCDVNNEGSFSAPLNVPTAKWGDVRDPFNVVNFLDISALVDKFKDKPGAIVKSRADIEPNIPNRIVNFLGISRDVDAFQGKPYPFAGPYACPSTATCPTLDACGRCTP